MKIYFVNICEIIDVSIFNRLLSLVSSEEQQQIGKLKHYIDMKLSLYSEVLVRYLACNTINIENEDIIFEKNEYGKPYLKNCNNVYFNISHTKSAFAVSISYNPIGVDIERIQTANNKIAQRFFTEDELAFVKETNSNQNKRFYEIWTKKEAYIKYIGKELSIPLNTFSILDKMIACINSTFNIDGYLISVCNDDVVKNNLFIRMFEDDIINLTLNLGSIFCIVIIFHIKYKKL
jgi:4'-phosphopantetheinyl transferase